MNLSGITRRTEPASVGFVYVATGQQYVNEARASAATLRRHHPASRVCLVTDQQPSDPPFWDDLVLLPAPRYGFRDKIEMRRSPYERSIYLDADTHIGGDITELFILLDRFDVCGVQLMEGHDYAMAGIPHAFAEINGGLLCFRKGERTAAFFGLWERYYDEFLALNQQGSYHYANVGDQKSLRAAVWHSDVRFATVGPEFNFIPFKVEFACLPVRMLHTRATDDIPQLFQRLNQVLARRAYVPFLDCVVGDPMPTSELWRLFSGSFRQLARRSLRGLLPARCKDMLRRITVLNRTFLGNRYVSSKGDATKKWMR